MRLMFGGRASTSGAVSIAAQALTIVADLAVTDGLAGPLLRAATGRPGLPAGFSVL